MSLRADLAPPIEATRCDVCGAFGAGDECCGKAKPFETVTWDAFEPRYWSDVRRSEQPEFFSGRPGSTIRYRGGQPGGGKREGLTSGGDGRPGPAARAEGDDVRERDAVDGDERLRALFGVPRGILKDVR